jgi:hypothetical protein
MFSKKTEIIERTDKKLKVATNLEDKQYSSLLDAIKNWSASYFSNLFITNPRTLIENDDFRKIVDIHEELKASSAKDEGVLPILVELMDHQNQHELLIPYVYISHQVPEHYANVHLALIGTPETLLDYFE